MAVAKSLKFFGTTNHRNNNYFWKHLLSRSFKRGFFTQTRSITRRQQSLNHIINKTLSRQQKSKMHGKLTLIALALSASSAFAQSTTATSSVIPTSTTVSLPPTSTPASLAPEVVACINTCAPSDTICVARCQNLPVPSFEDAKANVECHKTCNMTDIKAVIACQQACDEKFNFINTNTMGGVGAGGSNGKSGLNSKNSTNKPDSEKNVGASGSIATSANMFTALSAVSIGVLMAVFGMM